MKPFLTVLLLTLALTTTLSAQDNAIDKYFSQYVEDDHFSVIYISPKMFQMIGDIEINELDFEGDEDAVVLKDIAKDIKSLRILTTEATPDKFYKEFKAKINTSKYEVLMTVKEKDGGNLEFLAKGSNGETIDELLLLSYDDEFVLISFTGKINLSKVSKLARTVDKNEKRKED
ncbi:MAG: DUF4252 domain-containing protein [Saprospiraceae bacterium]|nr:DUF4252 domain-containing protein [Saprospiraceae bacterium]